MTDIDGKTNKEMRITVSKSLIVSLILFCLFICIPKSIGQDVYTTRDVYTTNYSVDPQAFAFYPGDTSTPFAFRKWGHYNTERYDGKVYFKGYSEGLLYDLSEIKDLPDGKGCTILIDSTEEHIMNSAGVISPDMSDVIRLKQGYELQVRAPYYLSENKAYVQLTKDGQVVDSKVINGFMLISPFLRDVTYCYASPVEGVGDLVIVAAHFAIARKEEMRTEPDGSTHWITRYVLVIDGIWQISDYATDFR